MYQLLIIQTKIMCIFCISCQQKIGKGVMQGWGILHGIPQIQWAKPKQNPNRSVCLNSLPTEDGQIRSKTLIVATNGPTSFYCQVANLFVFGLVSRMFSIFPLKQPAHREHRKITLTFQFKVPLWLFCLDSWIPGSLDSWILDSRLSRFSNNSLSFLLGFLDPWILRFLDSRFSFIKIFK